MCKISLKMKTLRCVKFLMKSRLLFLDFTDSKVLLYTHTIHFHKKILSQSLSISHSVNSTQS